MNPKKKSPTDFMRESGVYNDKNTTNKLAQLESKEHSHKEHSCSCECYSHSHSQLQITHHNHDRAKVECYKEVQFITTKEETPLNSHLGEDMGTKERLKDLQKSIEGLHDEIKSIKKEMPKKDKLENIEESVEKLRSLFKDFQGSGFLKGVKDFFTQSNTDSKYKDLKQKYEELEREHNDFKSKGKDLNKEYKQLKETNESLTKERGELESKTKDLARELTDKKNKLHQEKIRTTSLENDKERLEKTLNQKEKEITNLDSDLNYTKSELRTTQNNLQTTKDNLKDTQQELQDTTETLKDTKNKLKNTEQSLFALEQQHENLRKEFFVNLYEDYKQLDSDFKKCFLTIKDNNAINFFKTLYAPNVLGNFYEQIKARAKRNEDITLLKDYFERLFEVFIQDFNLERLITQQGDRYESSKHVSIGASGMSGNPIKEVLLLGFKDSTKTYQSLVKI
ncbi:hypothetical protein [Helicobacter cetorum]|uniref:hypothetical protein n=1 Tax=Helicobacter cetorum TaxID=138563 RepID=UPI000CF127AE|nr:hypothetical protein [Helicobacter cetorum]